MPAIGASLVCNRETFTSRIREYTDIFKKYFLPKSIEFVEMHAVITKTFIKMRSTFVKMQLKGLNINIYPLLKKLSSDSAKVYLNPFRGALYACAVCNTPHFRCINIEPY